VRGDHAHSIQRIADTADLWWRNAIVYCLDVETFMDGDGDGDGDFAGLTERVDYLAGIGVTVIWLMPFYPTPNRDDGYDISDYYAIDPRLGSFGDFTEFMRTATDRGIRVIVDLVVNHTSIEHPWFQASKDPASPYHDFYVWRDEIPADSPEGVVFPDEEDSLWEWDADVGKYYLHRFYSHQPDLNVASQLVRREIEKVVGFWLAQGLSGFRVDAVPFLLETDGIAQQMHITPHDYLGELRAFLSRRRGDALMLGEVNLPPDEARAFFGDEDGDELQMLFNFRGMQALYLALARADARPLREALAGLPPIPPTNQWATFVRNHDELTLDQLDDDERNEVFAAFGPEEHMQLFGRGLRRRVPPMLDGDDGHIRLVYSLLFGLPGTPVLFYGEEIGMGENLEIEGRRSVRTPMQWSPEPSGGFSTADRDDLRRPPPDGPFGPEHVNVADQRNRPDSLLTFFEHLIRQRKETPEIGFGDWEVVDVEPDAALVLRYRWAQRTVVVAANLGEAPVSVPVPVDDGTDQAERLLTNGAFPVTDGTVTFDLDRYGFAWVRLT
jgi:trehalose synthase